MAATPQNTEINNTSQGPRLTSNTNTNNNNNTNHNNIQLQPQIPQATQTTHQTSPPDPNRPTDRSTSQQDMDLTPGKLSSSPPGSYTRIVPRSVDPSAGPPILPPHLLQVILNNPDKTNTTILPQPNHVMLNHLYALSIKDGIMVLSATHRFRKKYVTSLLYKPI